MTSEKRLDRPELREKIIEIIASALSDNDIRPRAEEILALYPDELEYNPDYLDFQKGVEATKKIWKVKVEEAKKQLLEKITEDIIEMAGNFYMNDTDRKLFYELWRNFKRQALKGEK